MTESANSEIVLAPELQPTQTALAKFAAYVTATKVTDQDSYTRMTLQVKGAKDEMKKIGFVLDPGIASAKSHYEFLRDQKAGYVAKWQTQITAGDGMAREFLNEQSRLAAQRAADEAAEKARANRAKADEEARTRKADADEKKKLRIAELDTLVRQGVIKKREYARLLKEAGADAEAAKALAEEDAEDLRSQPVAPAAAPEIHRAKIAGVPRRRNYYVEMVDASKLVDAFLADASQRAFLRQFITIDESAIGRHVREVKDSHQVMATIPGVRAWDSF